jgi:hypothetical protein
LISIEYGKGNAAVEGAVAYVLKKNPSTGSQEATVEMAEAVTA